MPIVTATLIEGYDAETRERLSLALTDAVRSVIDAPLDGITVVLNEVAAEGYMRGGQRRQPGAPKPAAADLVRDFLAAMEARELERAKGFLADDFEMTFPGGVRFTALEELIDWSRGRYQNVGKTFERVDSFPLADGTAVYAFGTLAGTWNDGTDFAGIRFIDRFTVSDGKLREQRVWNDLGVLRDG